VRGRGRARCRVGRVAGRVRGAARGRGGDGAGARRVGAPDAGRLQAAAAVSVRRRAAAQPDRQGAQARAQGAHGRDSATAALAPQAHA
jgi:hypothetical protein